MAITTDSLFPLLADTTRLRVLMLLQQHGELCVCELTHALQLSQPKISRHLAQLREAGVLLTRRNGVWMYYRINPSLPDWAQAILQQTHAGNARAKPFAADQKRLRHMTKRPAVHNPFRR